MSVFFKISNKINGHQATQCCISDGDRLQLVISDSDKVMVSMDTLPEELLLRIFSHLPYSSLLSAGQTSKRWFRCSKDPLLLRAVASRDFSRDHSTYSDQEIRAAVFLG